jgi:hypothetical protein
MVDGMVDVVGIVWGGTNSRLPPKGVVKDPTTPGNVVPATVIPFGRVRDGRVIAVGTRLSEEKPKGPANSVDGAVAPVKRSPEARVVEGIVKVVGSVVGEKNI